MRARAALTLLAAPVALVLVLVPAGSALAAEAEPAVGSLAWYWEDQRRQKVTDPTSGTDVAVIELPNPFCPSTPATTPEETCKEGRLPVEVRNGDYETPNKISAVGFDLSMVPIGSKVGKFTATFVEASDDQSQPVNADGKELQACIVKEFFGDGEARLYEEAPKYECSKTDPIAKRKQAKAKGGQDAENARFVFTFDLTEVASEWVEKGAPVTAIMLLPVKPKPMDSDDSDWRTVLEGPAAKGGIDTSLVYTPAKDAPPMPPPDDADDGDDFGLDDGTGSITTTTGGGTETGLDGDTATEIQTPVDEGTDEPTDLAAETDQTGDEGPPPGLPGYVWLTLAGGLIAFSLVRSVVIERATGVRPDGVLAHIRRLNADRQGADAAAVAQGAGRSPVDSVMEGLKALGGKGSSFASKLPFRKRS